jgi:hypothetical protein
MFLLPQESMALARWECRGLTADLIVLTPYEDGTANLSFDKGPIQATAPFTHKGDVFTVIFQNLSGVQGAMLGYIIDTISRSGYEIGQNPSKPAAFAAKLTCYWYQN